jgi:hypothetical protein
MIFWCSVILIIFSWGFIKNIVKSLWIGCWHKDRKTITVRRHRSSCDKESFWFTYFSVVLRCYQCDTKIKVLKKYRFDNRDFVEKEAEKIRNKLKIFN